MLTDAQLKTLVLLPKITGAASCFFSGLIVWTVLRTEPSRRKCYHRLLCGISLIDSVTSFWLFMSSWALPASSPMVWSAGNDISCKMQGFFAQFAIGSSFYNCSLCIFFYLLIVLNWKEEHLIKVEWLLHCVPLLYATLSSVSGIFVDAYGPAPHGLFCTHRAEKESFGLYAFFLPLWVSILLVTVLCVYMWVYVTKMYRKAKRYLYRLAESSRTDEETPYPPETSIPGRSVSRAEFSKKAKSDTVKLELQTQRLKDIADRNFFYAAAFYLNWTAVSVCMERKKNTTVFVYPGIVLTL